MRQGGEPSEAVHFLASFTNEAPGLKDVDVEDSRALSTLVRGIFVLEARPSVKVEEGGPIPLS